MRSRTVFIRISIVLVIIALWGGNIMLVCGQDPWVSRKGVARDFGETKFFTLEETPITSHLRALRTSEVTREQADQNLSFIWEESKQDWQRGKIIGRIPPRYKADKNQVVTLPDGDRIRLAWASMGYDPELDDFPVREPFTPTSVTVRGDTWEPLDEGAFRRYHEEDLKFPTSTKSFLPKWRPGQFSLFLSFLHEGLPDFRTAGSIELMNLDTMTPLDANSGGSFNSFLPGRFHTMPTVRVFYPARIAAGFDVAYGPIEEVRFPLRPESGGKLQDLEIEIIAIERFSSSGWRDSNPGNRETRAISFTLDPAHKPSTYILFSLSAPELGRFCDLVLVNRNGEEETIKLGKSSTLSTVFTETLPEDLDEMVLRYRPNQARVVFELPPLRGVPEINRDIDNLFDVTLPHFKATEGWDLERAVTQQAGVRFNFQDAEFPEGYFPRYYENVTLGELLEEILAHHPEGSRIRLDPKTHNLFIPEPFSSRK